MTNGPHQDNAITGEEQSSVSYIIVNTARAGLCSTLPPFEMPEYNASVVLEWVLFSQSA